ncbi:clathrin adaptor complex small chain-domain-containing protein [Obelidium mucronatum]|nr:clathrin adaptor complex small chain-domain-containing protein [Obelidium mucronatum]
METKANAMVPAADGREDTTRDSERDLQACEQQVTTSFNELMWMSSLTKRWVAQHRPDSACNFLEGSALIGGNDTKIIYRHYATLYFVFVVDSSESELGILDLIQVLVEVLDKAFRERL